VKKQEITQNLLKTLFYYDENTGYFSRKKSTSNRIKVGDVAGSKHPLGYIRIMENKA